MEEIYNWIAQNMNYSVITMAMAVESSFIPFPSEIIIIPAAYIAINQGTLSLPLIVLFGTLGAIIGALVNYYLALRLGRPIIYRFADSKVGHMLLIDRPGVEKAEKYFDEHGAIGTFIGRLIPAIRQLISIPAGLARMKMPQFLLFTCLGAGIWNSILAGLGATLGHTMKEEDLIAKVQEYSDYIKKGIIVVVAIGLVIYVYKVIKANKEAKIRNAK